MDTSVASLSAAAWAATNAVSRASVEAVIGAPREHGGTVVRRAAGWTGRSRWVPGARCPRAAGRTWAGHRRGGRRAVARAPGGGGGGGGGGGAAPPLLGGPPPGGGY